MTRLLMLILGAGIAAGWDGVEFLSLRPRYRRWLSPTIALDASPGIRWTPGWVETVEARVATSSGRSRSQS